MKDQQFRWAVSEPLDRAVSRQGAVQFKRFVNAANQAYQREIGSVFPAEPPAAAKPEDEKFCGSMAVAAGIGGGPFGAAVVGGLCYWFASNGLD